MSAGEAGVETGAAAAARTLAPAAWRVRHLSLDLRRPRVVGILNVTPDSFYDGGRHDRTPDALTRALAMLDEGADAIDVGGESTRPGARPVSAAEEISRVLPVVRAVVSERPDVPVSVDTVKAEVARAVLDEGAAIINDVSAGRIEPGILDEIARADAAAILMHSRGGVQDMASYELAVYGADPVGEILDELRARAEAAEAAGVAAESIVLDPGLGFSKRTEHSAACVRRVDRFLIGYPVLVGPSRKRFVGDLGGGLPADARLEGTLAACVLALAGGARLFRVHDVAAARRALDVAAGLVEAA